MRKISKLFTRKNLPLLAVLLLELAFVAVRFAGDFRTGPVIDITPDRIIPYAEECTNDERGARVENFTGLFAVTRWVDIAPGSYQVSVTYVNNGMTRRVCPPSAPAPCSACGCPTAARPPSCSSMPTAASSG